MLNGPHQSGTVKTSETDEARRRGSEKAHDKYARKRERKYELNFYSISTQFLLNFLLVFARFYSFLLVFARFYSFLLVFARAPVGTRNFFGEGSTGPMFVNRRSGPRPANSKFKLSGVLRADVVYHKRSSGWFGWHNTRDH